MVRTTAGDKPRGDVSSARWIPPPFRPHPLLRGGHLQTALIGVDFGRVPPYRARRHVLPLGDGEAVVVHEDALPDLPLDAPVVLLLHGLGGAHCSPYLRRIAAALSPLGLRVWRADLRGCGAGIELAWQPANAGRSGDVAVMLDEAHRRFPTAPLLVAGFSLSGNIVLKMLGELAAGALPYPALLDALTAALAVAPPVDLQACADNMERPSRRLYAAYYLRLLERHVAERRAVWPQWRSIPIYPRPRTIRQFDARYTAPLSGFASVEEYYTLSSAASWLPSIRTPTTVVLDSTDPIVDYAACRAAPFAEGATHLVVTRGGGHMAYYGLGRRGGVVRWMEEMAVDWCCAQVRAAGRQSE